MPKISMKSHSFLWSFQSFNDSFLLVFSKLLSTCPFSTKARHWKRFPEPFSFFRSFGIEKDLSGLLQTDSTVPRGMPPLKLFRWKNCQFKGFSNSEQRSSIRLWQVWISCYRFVQKLFSKEQFEVGTLYGSEQTNLAGADATGLLKIRGDFWLDNCRKSYQVWSFSDCWWIIKQNIFVCVDWEFLGES